MTTPYKTEDFLEAIPGTMGIKTHIARKVGCEPNTVRRWIKDDARVRDAWRDERNKLKEKAVEGLAKHLNAGEWKAIHFALTNMTDDGTFEPPSVRHEHSGVGGGAIQITRIVERRGEEDG